MIAQRSAVNFIVLKVMAFYLIAAALVLAIFMVVSYHVLLSQQQGGLAKLANYVETVLSIKRMSPMKRDNLISHYLDDNRELFSCVALKNPRSGNSFNWVNPATDQPWRVGELHSIALNASSDILLVQFNHLSMVGILFSQFGMTLFAMLAQLVLLVVLIWVLVRRSLRRSVFRFVKELSLINLKKPTPIQYDSSLSQFIEYRQIIGIVNRVLLSLARSREALAATNEELEQRIAFRTAALASKNKILLELNQQLSVVANTDALTQVYNRTRFDQLFSENLAFAQQHKAPLSILLIDLDNFKKVNDQYGHQVGDQVLKHSADCINKVVGQNGFVCRWGGEEFAVLLPYYDIELARCKAEHIRGSLARSRNKAFDLTVTVSIGVAELGTDEQSSEVLKRADDALYDAKAHGRNCVVCAKCPGPDTQLAFGEMEKLNKITLDVEQAPNLGGSKA